MVSLTRSNHRHFNAFSSQSQHILSKHNHFLFSQTTLPPHTPLPSTLFIPSSIPSHRHTRFITKIPPISSPPHYLLFEKAMEDNLDPIEDTQYEDEDEMFSSTEEEEEEVIDYDGMKSALEMFQQVRASIFVTQQTHSHSLLGGHRKGGAR